MSELFNKRMNMLLQSGSLGGKLLEDSDILDDRNFSNDSNFKVGMLYDWDMNELEEVESIDECLFAIKKEHFLKMMFDQVVCNHWHLYGVELCYHGKKSDMKLVPMVTSTQVYHKMESGTGLEVDKNFLKIIGKLCRKYKDEKKIYAPCYIISTKFPKRQLKILRTRMKLILKK